jgi:hypothetical protein
MTRLNLLTLLLLVLLVSFLLISHLYRDTSTCEESITTESITTEDDSEQPPIEKYFFVGVLNTCDDLGSERRRILRKWMKQYTDVIDYYFVLDRIVYPAKGHSYDCEAILATEQKEYNDLLFLDTTKLQQGVSNLTYKVEIFFLHIGKHFRNRYRYIFKTDDDSVVKFDKLKQVFVEKIDNVYTKDHPEINSEKKLVKSLYAYAGHFLVGSKVLEAKFKGDTGLEKYGRYAAGSGYAASAALINAVYAMATSFPVSKWEAEDASFGHWVSTIQHVNLHLGVELYAVQARYCTPTAILYHPIKNTKQLDRLIDIANINSTEACVVVQSPIN